LQEAKNVPNQLLNTVSLQDRFCFKYTGCARKVWWFTIFVTLYEFFKIEFFTLHL